MSDPRQAQLEEMGFAPALVSRALAANATATTEQAMEWIFSHMDDPVDDNDNQGSQTQADGDQQPGGDDGAPKEAGLLCTDCQTTFATVKQAELHASKTGHASFEEVEGAVVSGPPRPPLTPEEVAERASKLKAKIAQAKAKREEDEAEAERKREIARREAGKNTLELKRKMEEDAIRRAAEEKRRQKEEERMARERVKMQIERDKQARRERQKQQQQQQQQQGGAVSGGMTAAAPSAPLPVSAGSKDYTECLLQIRLTNGSAMRATFKATDTLTQVCDHIRANRTDGAGAFSLMTPLPRRIFGQADMSKSLKDLDLGPRAALTVTKS